jgi:hypothetical protein
MTTTKSTLLLVLLIASGLTFGQNSVDTIKRKNYCIGTHCTLKPDNPVHFDPYYNWHLCENFNPEQIDFSNEYFALQIKYHSKDTNKLRQTLKYDYSPIWLSGNWEQNGVLGLNCQRIQIHIDKVTKSNNPTTYFVFGKTKVNNVICNFKGEIELVKLFFYDTNHDSEYQNSGDLFAKYIFYEDSSQFHSGIFKGVTECSVYLDSSEKYMHVDESSRIADGYWNRTFVGTWTDYKTKVTKKCIWGDYRLPFTFDFDCGDGEMHVCDKYIKNGWQTFGDGSEYIFVAKDQYEIKNKWWLSIQK